MIAYFIVLAIIMIYCSFTKNKLRDGYRPFIFIALVLILFQGLRNYTVGTDTSGYCNSFLQDRGWMGMKLQWENLSQLLDEPGFAILNHIAKAISDNYASLLLTSALVAMACALTSIKQNSVNIMASLFAFITLAFYLFGFAAIRQSIALCIFMLSFKYLNKGDFTKYALVIFIAFLFHKSVIVTLPFFFIARLKYGIKSMVIMVVIGIITGLIMPTMLAFGSTIEARYALYQTGKAIGGEMLTLFAVCLAIFFMIARSQISRSRRHDYDIYLHLVMVSAVIYLVVTFTGSYVELNRFAMYFQVPAIFLYAEYYNAIVREYKGNQLPLIVLSLAFIAYYTVYILQIGNIKDYLINTSVF